MYIYIKKNASFHKKKIAGLFCPAIFNIFPNNITSATPPKAYLSDAGY